MNLAKAGIKIHVLDGKCQTSRNTGGKSPYADEFASLINKGVIYADNNGDVDKLLDTRFDGYIVKTENMQKKLITHCRITEDGTRIIFAANMGYDKIADKMHIREKFSKVYCSTPETGTVEESTFELSADGTSIDIGIDGIKAKIYIMIK